MEQLPLFDIDINSDKNASQLMAEYNRLVTHDGKTVNFLQDPKVNRNPVLTAAVWAAAIERRQVQGVEERIRGRRYLARCVLLHSSLLPEGDVRPTTYWNEAMRAVASGACDVMQLRTVLDVLHPNDNINNNSVYPRVVRWKVRGSILPFDLLPSEFRRTKIQKVVRGYVRKQFPALTTISPWHYHYQVIAEGHLLQRMGWVDESDLLNKFDEAREKRFLDVSTLSGRPVGDQKALPNSIRAVIRECLDRPRAREATKKVRKYQQQLDRWDRRREEVQGSPLDLHVFAAQCLAAKINQKPEDPYKEDSQS